MYIQGNTFINYFLKYTSFVSMSTILYIEPDSGEGEYASCQLVFNKIK